MVNKGLKDVFHNSEDFFSFLEGESRSLDYIKAKERILDCPHPGYDALYAYVLEEDEDNDRLVGDHILLCKECAEKVLEIRLLEDEMETSLGDSLPIKEQPPLMSVGLLGFIWRIIAFDRLLVGAMAFSLIFVLISLAIVSIMDKEPNQEEIRMYLSPISKTKKILREKKAYAPGYEEPENLMISIKY